MSTVMTQGFIITLVGMLTVFLVLIVLSYCFQAMKLLSGLGQAKPKVIPAPVQDAGAADSEVEVDVTDENEIAAAIMAALTAYMGDEHVVVSIRRLEDATAWSRTGRHDQMASAL